MKGNMTKPLRVLVLSTGLVVIACLALFLGSQKIVADAVKGKIISFEEVSYAEAIIVPGASVLRSGAPSDILADRLLTAQELYEAGKADVVLLSGSQEDDYNETARMKEFLVSRGISEEGLLIDENGLDTFATMKHAKEMFGIDEAIIVSQSYHLPRAIYLAGQFGIDAVGVSSDRQPYVKIKWFTFREMFSRVKAVLEVWFRLDRP